MIFAPCDVCGSEGRIYRDCTGRWDLDPQERDDGECPYCEGTGMMEVESEPVEEDDDEFFAGWRNELSQRSAA